MGVQLNSIFKKPIYLSAPTRSPIGKFGGIFSHLSAPQLASITLAETARRAAGLRPDFVILGQARQAGSGPNPARQAVIGSQAYPDAEFIPAFTINQACASGLSAIFSAIEKIALKRATHILAGGVEAMSQTPYLLMRARFGLKMGHDQVLDGMHRDGFYCPMSQMLMGETVENVLVPEYKISRIEQDEYALQSQKKAEQAWKDGLFTSETFVPTELKVTPKPFLDEHVRENLDRSQLEKLPPVFNPKAGTITAGNSSGITDGAAFVWVSEQIGLRHSPTCEVLDYETIALSPKRMGLGPVAAISHLLDRNRLDPKAIDAYEINEAFAAQVIACQRELGLPPEKLNAWGGAIALGHPIGASGARVLVTLMHRLKQSKGELGIASLCVSGGQGVAILIRNTA